MARASPVEQIAAALSHPQGDEGHRYP
jgi:hypothetical protein